MPTSAMIVFTIPKGVALVALVGVIVYSFILRLMQRKERTIQSKAHLSFKQQKEDPKLLDRESRSLIFESGPQTPVSVNYHFTRKCNKTCGFCFHTEKSSYVAKEEHMMRGLQMLKDAGMRKINFAGGEPFLYPKRLAMLCRYAKHNLQLESVSIITNGTKVTEKWLRENSQYVDILGVSCDSFDEATNIKIGRGTGENVTQLFRIRDWCSDFGVKLKINTVVCKLNWGEDMSSIVSELKPFRWKCFQVLVVENENDSPESLVNSDLRKRNARRLLISDQQYEAFCDRHNLSIFRAVLGCLHP
jgi:radical S-adenosyl methionine domain-containing protein 2